MNKNNRNNEQIYGRNDMIMLDQSNKIYGSLGIADNYVMKTEEGTKLILSNPKLGSFDDVLTEFNIYGMSKQFTTTGKNLINADKYYSKFKQSDGTYKAKTVTLNDISISLSEFVGKEITLSVNLTVGANTSSVFLMYISSEQKKINGSTIKSGLTGKSILTVTPVSNTDYFVISFGSGNDDVTFSELQLELGSVATSYEPYTGGNPSPSPEYPQQIVSAGSDGKIGVEVRGKNLFELTGIRDNEYLRIEKIENNTIYARPTNMNAESPGTTNYSNGWVNFSEKIKVISGILYTISLSYKAVQKMMEIEKLDPARILVFKDSENIILNEEIKQEIGKYVDVEIPLLIPDGTDSIYFTITCNNYSVAIKNIQIEEGGYTSYEPYHEPQSLSISTPTGLPAIPVDSDGNYTDANGQQWIADYIDFKRGKLVKIVNSLILDGNELKFVADPTNTYWNLPQQSAVKPIGYDILSNYFKIRVFFSNEYSNFIYTTQKNMVGLFETVDELNAFVVKKYQENDAVVLYYRMQEPIETDLAPEEIEQYKKLSTKTPTMIVENNYNTWMKATYKSTESV
jgi:hypothetical protein